MTLNWLIERLLVKPVEGSNTDVVVTSDWRCNGSQESFSGTAYGSTSFAAPSGDFTPYKDLTQDQILGWCFASGVDQAAIEANVSLQIQNQIHPPVVSLPLPWIEVVPPLVEQRIPQLRDEQIVDPFNLPTSDVPPSVDGMTDTILG